ncbi:MAG: monovalent cation/H(+) antiporter subunit G, partial [Candidatus Thiodiazotropha sp.]
LLRLPDLHTRLHALTKADNLGLGLLMIGVALLHGSLLVGLKLLLALLGSTDLHLLRKCPGPVWVDRPGVGGNYKQVLATVNPMVIVIAQCVGV